MAGVARIENCRAIRESDRAVLVDVDGEEVWIPQSQIHDDSEVWKQGDEGALVIAQWLADAKGIG